MGVKFNVRGDVKMLTPRHLCDGEGIYTQALCASKKLTSLDVCVKFNMGLLRGDVKILTPRRLCENPLKR